MAIADDNDRQALGMTEANQNFFATLVASLVVVNTLAFIHNLSGVAAFGAVGNTVCVVLILYAALAIMRGPIKLSADKLFLLISATLISISIVGNAEVASLIISVKYFSLYVFYAAGRTCGGRISHFEVLCILVLAALPLVFIVLGTSQISGAESVGYLPNANTAALYFSALLFAVAAKFGSRVLLLQFLQVAVLQKVGAALATLGAIGIWALFPLRLASIPILISYGVAGIIGYAVGAFDRLENAIAQLEWIIKLSPAVAAKMPYGQLVGIVGSTDLSTFFRLIHWTAIWEFFREGGLWIYMFGYGAGQTLVLFQLEPHNDYLRILAEFGALNFAVFVGFLVYVIASVHATAERVLFGVLLIYFFSENLIDNFTSMALFFAYAGRVAAEGTSRFPGAP